MTGEKSYSAHRAEQQRTEKDEDVESIRYSERLDGNNTPGWRLMPDQFNLILAASKAGAGPMKAYHSLKKADVIVQGKVMRIEFETYEQASVSRLQVGREVGLSNPGITIEWHFRRIRNKSLCKKRDEEMWQRFTPSRMPQAVSCNCIECGGK